MLEDMKTLQDTKSVVRLCDLYKVTTGSSTVHSEMPFNAKGPYSQSVALDQRIHIVYGPRYQDLLDKRSLGSHLRKKW